MKARHVMIRASAGSGKTHALTNRFIALLAEGAAPERIVALTFTRKAAGEFFDQILHRLAVAAEGGAPAAELARQIDHPALGAADFLRLLRGVIEAMPRLPLGTLDSFFGRIVRAFPLELGLAGDFEILQEHTARLARRRVLQRMFARGGGASRAGAGLADEQREFIEAFKRATFGTEEKQLGARLDEFLDRHQETYLDASSGALWGNQARIWPQGCPWLAPVAGRLGAAIASLQARLTRLDLSAKQRARWEAGLAALPEWSPGAPLPDPVAYLLKNALLVWADIRRGAAEMTVERRKVALGPGECADLALIVTHLIGGELQRRLEITRGIHAVLTAYEHGYDEQVRRSGQLTFSDVQRLLQPAASGIVLTRGAAAGQEGRLAIDFRLDAQFDHWLLDEFQDTSRGQWSILENLIDEAVQDPTGARSFFCVGDVKQAIFTWREGDPRLFREVLERYNATARPAGADRPAGPIAEEHLVRSYRSAPPIIAMVNAIFGCSGALAELFPGTASETWNREWLAHESAKPNLAGLAAWEHAADEAGRLERMLAVLREIDPRRRRLECAVLVQTNAMARTVAEYLRREGGIPALAESDLQVGIDNPLGNVLLALLQSAAHPGDTLAREHVAMSPLGGLLQGERLTTPETVTERILGQLQVGGFARTLEYWVRRLEETLAPGDAFSRERGRQLLTAAALFDASGSREVAEFIAFVQRYAIRGTELAGVVRVMTIHKSKGLGFDVVVLPDLEGQKLDRRRDGLAVQRAADRTVEWVLDPPPRLFLEQDDTLRAHLVRAEAEACYEALALLYVGLTRAVRAMYVITSSPGRSGSRNYPKVLAATLGDTPWSTGDLRWYEAIPNEGPPLPAPSSAEAVVLPAMQRVRRRPARRPSSAMAGPVPAPLLFSPGAAAAKAAEFGSQVHKLLSGIEWAESFRSTDWDAHGLPAPVVAEALACLEAPALGHVWRQPLYGQVWRERAFEIVLDEAWVAGVFDRVVIECEATGEVRGVAVYDFKTDSIEDTPESLAAACQRHAAQLNVYRRVAAVLTGRRAEQVRCELVFTKLQRAAAVPAHPSIASCRP